MLIFVGKKSALKYINPLYLRRDQEWKVETGEVSVKTENTVKGRDVGRLYGSEE